MNSNSTGKQHPKRNDWFDWWLSDEQPGPKAQQQIRHFRVKQANSYRKRNVPTPKPPQVAPAADSDGKSLVINLSIPKIKPPKFDFIKVKNGKYQLDLKLTSLRTLAVIICGVILASVAFSHLFSRSSAPASTTGSEAAQAASNSNSLPKISGETQTAAGQNLQSGFSANSSNKATAPGGASPTFTPAVPITESELIKPTPIRTAYDPSRKVYTIMDSFRGAPLTINEQALPSLQPEANQAAVKENAAQVGIAQPISLPASTAYMVTDSKTNIQTVIFYVRNVLVYVNSLVQHSADDWKGYISLFQ
jgi:hypothetical protein